MPLRQPEPSLLPIPVYLHLEEVARSLLLEPFTCVPLVNACCLRELYGCQRAPIGDDPVETETLTDVNRKEIERADRVHEQPFDEGVAPFGGISHACHKEPSCRSHDLPFRVERTQARLDDHSTPQGLARTGFAWRLTASLERLRLRAGP